MVYRKYFEQWLYYTSTFARQELHVPTNLIHHWMDRLIFLGLIVFLINLVEEVYYYLLIYLGVDVVVLVLALAYVLALALAMALAFDLVLALASASLASAFDLLKA